MAKHNKFNINGIDAFDNVIMDMTKAEKKTLTVTGKNKPENKHFAIVNTRSNEVAQIVSDQYKILNHKDFFSMVSDTVRSTGSENMKGYVLESNDGDSYTVRFIFDDIEVTEPGKGQNIKVGMEFSNSYDSAYAARGRAFFLRISCYNQMILQNIIPECMFSRSHSARSEIALLEAVTIKAENFAKQLVQSGVKFQNVMEDAIGDNLVFEKPVQVEDLFKQVFTERHAQKISDIARRAATRSTEGYNLTRWDLYNAVTDYVSHQPITPNVFEQILVKAENKILNNKALEVPAIPVRA